MVIKWFYSLLLIMLPSLLTPIFSVAGTVSEVTYNSTTSGGNRKMMVYLPDGYNGTTYFPTFYLVHGGGQDHNAWVREGDAKGILDKAISSGKSKPMIVVMPNVTDFAMDKFTKELCNEIIPYIEKNYKATISKDTRALAGLSWGGLQVLDAGLYRYDLFGYLGVFSSGWFIGDNVYNVMRNYLKDNATKIESSMRYFYFGEGGTSDIAYKNGMETLKLLRESGLTVNYYEHTGSHSFVAWKQDLSEFLPFLFQDEITSITHQSVDENLMAFPNPFVDVLEIKISGSYDYSISTLSGQVLELGDESELRKGKNLLSGTYILKIQNQNFKKYIKIFKQ